MRSVTIKIFMKLIVLILVLLPDLAMGIPIRIKVVFSYFMPQNVQCGSDFTGWWVNFDSEKNGNTYFISRDTSTGNHLFNIEFNHPSVSSKIYVSTVYRNLHRIVYSKVYINDQLLGSDYVNKDGNINFNIDPNGNISQVIDTGKKMINDMIPPEVHWPTDTVIFDTPPAEYLKVIGWAQVLHDNNYISESKVEVDYVKLFARKGTDIVLLDSTGYDSFNTDTDGGLYLRYPFFPDISVNPTPMPATAMNGMLVFYPSSAKESVWHWWNPVIPQAGADTQYTSYCFEVKYRITGKAAIQLGIDFRVDNNNVLEGAISKWGFDSYGEWEILRVDTKPYPVTSMGESNAMPTEFQLYHNYPNPFNSNTIIKYSIANYKESYDVILLIYDALGNEVATLVNEKKKPGNYEVNFNAASLASGVYFYQLQAGDFVSTKKLLLIK